MNSTQAIREAITFIQWTLDYMENSADWDEVNTHPDYAKLQEVISQLQRLPQASGSNYGTLWSINDLRSLRPAWSDEKLTDWMESRNGDLQDRQCEDGWEVIGFLLDDQDLCEGCGEETDDTNDPALCPTCEADPELAPCAECEHPMRQAIPGEDRCDGCRCYCSQFHHPEIQCRNDGCTCHCDSGLCQHADKTTHSNAI